MNDLGADFIYTGQHPATFMLPNGLKEIMNADVWQVSQDRKNAFPQFSKVDYLNATETHPYI